jgi:hypothetical protein
METIGELAESLFDEISRVCTVDDTARRVDDCPPPDEAEGVCTTTFFTTGVVTVLGAADEAGVALERC